MAFRHGVYTSELPTSILPAREMILGGSISFDESDNPTTDLIDGIARFHLRITPPPANREIDGIVEFDTDNLSVLFS